MGVLCTGAVRRFGDWWGCFVEVFLVCRLVKGAVGSEAFLFCVSVHTNKGDGGRTRAGT